MQRMKQSAHNLVVNLAPPAMVHHSEKNSERFACLNGTEMEKPKCESGREEFRREIIGALMAVV